MQTWDGKQEEYNGNGLNQIKCFQTKIHAWWDWRWPSCHSWAFLPVHYGTQIFSFAHGGKQGCKFNFTPLTMLPVSSADGNKWQIIISQPLCLCPSFPDSSLLSVAKLCLSGDRKISSWRLSQLLTSEGTFSFATAPPLSLYNTSSTPAIPFYVALTLTKAHWLAHLKSWCFV